WDTMDLSANHKGPYFAVTNPQTGEQFFPPKGRYWVFNEPEVVSRIADGRIIFGKSGNARPVQKVLLKDRKSTKRKAESWWDNHGMNEDATAELTSLFGVAKIFSHPKPSKLLKNICSIVLEKNDIVLDFFSGSGTTADAVMQLNAEITSINARFIMVQLPEDLIESLASADNNAKAAIQAAINFLQLEKKPLLLTEIGKERIRRAGKKILDEHPEAAGQLDIGFRVLKIDTTNMQDVYYSPAEYKQDEIVLFADNIKPDRTSEDLLFQVMLDLGVLLSSKIEETTIGGKVVFNVADGYLLACFDSDVTSEVITEVAQKQPYYAVFRDSSIASDSVATNFEQIFATYSPTTVRKVL
ncbi:MAG: DNA methyltransferase, partial [Eubacteriales bacterium]|nr:DNA methyltransferase [Eubacteriales bacterium]